MSIGGRRAGALLATLLAVSCAVSDRPYPWRLDVERAFELDSWNEAELRGFIVSTNATEADARAVLVELARFLDLADRILGVRPAARASSPRLFLLRDSGQFRGFADPGTGGHAILLDDGVILGLPVDRGRVRAAAAVLFHELVHRRLYQDSGFDYPSWYHEGMGELLGSSGFRENLAIIGRVPEMRIAALRQFEPLDFARIFGARGTWEFEGEDSARFYADSWAVVRFLHGGLGARSPNHHRAMLRFVGLQSEGVPWREAFAASFDAPVDEVEKQFADFRKGAASGVANVVYVELPEGPPEIELRPISATEASLRLGSYALAAGKPALATAFHDFALEDDPASATGLIGRAVALASLGRHEEASADLERVRGAPSLAADVAEARGRIALARYRSSPEEPGGSRSEHLAAARGHFGAALELDSDRGSCWAALAEAYALDPGADAERGMRAAEAAGELLPSHPRLDLTRARLSLRLGRPEEARALVESVLRSIHGGSMAEQARAILAEIDEAS